MTVNIVPVQVNSALKQMELLDHGKTNIQVIKNKMHNATNMRNTPAPCHQIRSHRSE